MPPLAAVANAIAAATGVRMSHVPMSPPRVLEAIRGQAGGQGRKAPAAANPRKAKTV